MLNLRVSIYNDCGYDRNGLNEVDKSMPEPLLKQNPLDILAYTRRTISISIQYFINFSGYDGNTSVNGGC